MSTMTDTGGDLLISPIAHEHDRVVDWMSQPRTAAVYSRALG
jgi:hypothetical protein